MENDFLIHYGVKRRSGRYPWGSGDSPYQRSGDFLTRYKELKDLGMKETDIAAAMGTPNYPLTTTDLRVYISVANHDRRRNQIARVKSLQADGLNNSEIGRRMGIGESSVRSLLKEDSEAKMNAAMNTAEFLKKRVEEDGMIDIGAGAEKYLGITEPKLKEAMRILEADGYPIHGVGVPQVTNDNKQTNVTVLCPPGTTQADVYQNRDKIKSVGNFISVDDGMTFDKGFKYPSSLDPKRLDIRYAEDGGTDKDGLIEIRRGTKDLNLGDSNYAQVRILVNDTHYLKGMAVYSDDLPDGIDIRFNTSKSKSVPMMADKGDTVLKRIKRTPDGEPDRDNPFGSLIKEHGGQSYYLDDDGKQKLSLINKRGDEGDWNEWSNKLPSQFLSKQPKSLVDKQLGLALVNKQSEFDEIKSLTNPVVRKKFLNDFADDCDRTAVHLDAAALPRQKYQVIIPVSSLKDNEVYAPNYNAGERVALIRYPHAGTFEIPILTVNNKNQEAQKILGKTPADAVGINANVARRMSGADFDGDTVMVIPLSDKVNVVSTPQLEGLKNFDPTVEYAKTEGMQIMDEEEQQKQMGVISNLISDMTLREGADSKELARAVRHSMVIIDAVKHELDYKASEQDNGILELKEKYQGHYNEKGNWSYGAGTIISRAKSEVRIPERKEGKYLVDPETGKKKRYLYDPDTGEKLYTETDRRYLQAKDPKQGNKWVPAYEKDGLIFYKGQGGKYIEATPDIKTKEVESLVKSTKMAEAKDAFDLVSEARNPIEMAYAKYANEMKKMANEARLEMMNTPRQTQDPNAKKTYAKEVDELTKQVDNALMNAPRERYAQIIANGRVDAKKQANPDMTKKELKKVKQQELVRARIMVGASRKEIEITDKQWEAIQAGAVSNNTLEKVMRFSNQDRLLELAMPKDRVGLTTGQVARIKAYAKSGYTTSEIAKALNVSTSTVNDYLNEKKGE